MADKEAEPLRALEGPIFSPKTSYERLKEFSTQRWQTTAITHIASDMVNNVKEWRR